MNFEDIKLKYALERLETIISKDLSSFIENNCELDEWLIADFKIAIQEETETIKENLRQAMFCFKDDRSLEIYIQYHQQALIRLAGHLLNYVQPAQLNTVSDPLHTEALSQCLYQSLEELLTFIEIHFTRYFDQNAWIPANYRRIVLHEISSNLDDLNKDLLRSGVAKDLLTRALLPLKKFVEGDSATHIAYRKVIYLKELKKELVRISTQRHQHSINRSLRSLLYYLNFNSPEYFDYCVQYIQRELDLAKASIPEQIRILTRYQKLVSQTPVKPGFILEANLSALSDRLAHWINIEIAYLEKNKQLDKDLPGESDKLLSRFKILINLSVSQLAYLIKVLLEVRIIQNRNKSQLTRFITRIFQTTQRETIATQSIRKKLYVIEDNTRHAVKAVLLKMIDHIDTDRGEMP